MSRDQPFDSEKAYCAIQSINSVLLALIETHPNPAELALALQKSAEKSRDFFLEGKNTDRVINLIEEGIIRFAIYAEAYSERESS